jgi:4-aminobutyrate aminotransferase-like enzyme
MKPRSAPISKTRRAASWRRHARRATMTHMAAQTVSLRESKILRASADKTPRSRALHRRAKKLLPNGVTHAGWHLEPPPVYIDRAEGSRKRDVDGNGHVDYFGGHGALILGHNHPAVVENVAAQAGRGAHYGASLVEAFESTLDMLAAEGEL